MQQQFDSKMAEEIAVLITENVRQQLEEIVEQDTEFSPLTKEDHKMIKNVEAEVEKEAKEPRIKQYLLELKRFENEGEHKEHPPDVKIVQQKPAPWPMQSNVSIKKDTTWQILQRPPTPTPDTLPPGPMPLPPPRYEDPPGQHQISFIVEAQCDWQAGKRLKEEMKAPCDPTSGATASTTTPQPKRSKKEAQGGEPDAEMEVPTCQPTCQPTATEHFVVATPIRQRSPPTISPTQPFNQPQERAIVTPTPATTRRTLPSHHLLQGAQTNLLAQQAELSEARGSLQQDMLFVSIT